MTEKPMSKAERSELIRIVKARFAILGEQMSLREEQLRRIAGDRVTEEHAAVIKKYSLEASRLQTKLSDLLQRSAAEGLWTNSRALDLQFRPTSFAEKRDQEEKKVREEVGYKRIDLRMLEVDLIEELLIGGLESGAARAFLDRIPTPERLLPLPENGTKAVGRGRKS